MSFIDKAKAKLEEVAKDAKPKAEALREKAKPMAEKLQEKAGEALDSAKKSAEAFREGHSGKDEPPTASTEAPPTG